MARVRSRLLPLLSLFLIPACTGGSPPDPTVEPQTSQAVDVDGDGVAEQDDCDDQDAAVGALNDDRDCDGAVTSEDCDDEDPALGATSNDADCDSFLTDVDCDDSNAAMPLEDADCDGWLTADDCDDGDALTYPGAPERLFFDANCDGSIGNQLGLADFSFVGSSSSGLGSTLSAAGDFDGDGLKDLLLGAPKYCDGTTYLIYGASLAANPSMDLSQADHIFTGAQSGPFGCTDSSRTITAVGDMDGDGLDEIAIAAEEPGDIYLVLGSSLGGAQMFDLTNADYIFLGPAHTDLGSYMADAGDVDGDGRADLLIGTHDNNVTGRGFGYLVLGSVLGATPMIQLEEDAIKFQGENNWDLAGQVASAGDVDGDGLSDILIGAGGANLGGTVYLILGSSVVSEGTIRLVDADYKLHGEDVGDFVSASTSAGDIDGDGLDDLLVGGSNAGSNGGGVTYVVLGASLGVDSDIRLADAAYSFQGENPGDDLGMRVASAGDVDGDGLPDMLFAATRFDSDWLARGRTYLVLASSLTPGRVSITQADYDFLGEASNDNSGWGLSSGDVNGDGRSDILVGAGNNGDGGNGAGKAYFIPSPL